ncbi:MAG: hypothetical protein K6C68_12805 [Ruminococcus sp.]|nr:hypothetical protein [Ruminococcus sp.]
MRYTQLLSGLYPSKELYPKLLPQGDPLKRENLLKYGLLCIGRIGDGSFSDVYHAKDICGRRYAVKVMRAEKMGSKALISPLEVTRRTLGEIELLEKLNDVPSVVHLNHYYPDTAEIRRHIRLSEENKNEYGKQPKIVQVMPLCMPYNAFIKWLLHDGRRLTEEELAALIIDLIVCVYQLHDKGIVHRDIKPANTVLLQHDDGNIGTAAIDLNVSKRFKEYVDYDYTPVGAERYAHPMLVGNYDAVDLDTAKKGDIYSIGVIGYQLANGGELPSPSRYVPDPKNLPSPRMGRLIRSMMNPDISMIPTSDELLTELYRITEDARDAVFVSPEKRTARSSRPVGEYVHVPRKTQNQPRRVYNGDDCFDGFFFGQNEPHVQTYIKHSPSTDSFDSAFDKMFGDDFDKAFAVFDDLDSFNF